MINGKSKHSIWQPISSQRSNRLDLLQTASSLNKVLSRKAKSGVRIESNDRADNKISFASNIETNNELSSQIKMDQPNNVSNSFQQNLNNDDDEDAELDEHYPGENSLRNENNSINKSAQYCKRSMSEMQKSIVNLSKCEL